MVITYRVRVRSSSSSSEIEMAITLIPLRTCAISTTCACVHTSKAGVRLFVSQSREEQTDVCARKPHLRSEGVPGLRDWLVVSEQVGKPSDSADKPH